jgi:3-oxoacyl-[acyl-carrier-protein] synthase-3
LANVKIIQTASFVPQKVVTNDELSKIMDTSDEWISTRTGIKQRHISLDENTSVLCTRVAKQLLTQSGWSAESLDLIIVATMSPDSYTPATAALVQGNIQAQNAVAFDISAACSGFIYALEVAKRFLSSPDIKRVMVIGGEVLSKVLDWQDRTTAVLFGDGAAGVLLAKDETKQSQILATDLKTFGDQGKNLIAGTTQAICQFPNTQDEKLEAFQMDGREVYKFATHEVPISIERACQKADISLDEVTHFILHQANARIIQSIAKRLKQPLDKFGLNIADYGNTSAASVPLLLDELNKKGQLKRGQIIVLSGFGGGLTVGTHVIKF